MPLGAFKTALLGAAGSGGGGKGWETLGTADYGGQTSVNFTGIDPTKYSILRVVFWEPGNTSAGGANPVMQVQPISTGSYRNNWGYENVKNGSRYLYDDRETTYAEMWRAIAAGDSSNVGYGQSFVAYFTTGPRDSVTSRQVWRSTHNWWGNGNNPAIDNAWGGNSSYNYGTPNTEGTTNLYFTVTSSWSRPTNAVISLYGLAQP